MRLADLVQRLRRAPARTVALAMGVALVAAGIAVAARDGDGRPAGLFTSPSPAPSAGPTPSVSPSPSGSPERTPSPSPSARRDRLALFRGLGAWVDLFDHGFVDPAVSVADMERRGVETLYLQTGRFLAQDDVVEPGLVGRWLELAHDAGMGVVGWYVPGYGDMRRDVRRQLAVRGFRSPRGDRFDGMGVDIESLTETGGGPAFNGGILDHLRSVRRAAGREYPIAAITPTPLGIAVAPEQWAGFPWKGLARDSDVLMLMSYWSYRKDCPVRPDHCAAGYTDENVRRGRRLSGLPVHVIGGVGDVVTTAQVRDFVRAAVAAGVVGGSLYDYRTTHRSYWRHLGRFRGL